VSDPVLWILVHDLDGGGVPEVLVRYLRWLRRSYGSGEVADRPSVHVVARRGGSRTAATRALARTCTTLEPDGRRSAASTVALAAAQLGHPRPGAAIVGQAARRRVRSLPRPDIVLVHGAGGWPLWRALAPAVGRARLVVHLHELAVAIGRSVPGDELSSLAAEPDVLLSVCPPDAGLRGLLGARAHEVVVVPGCVEAIPAAAAGAVAESRASEAAAGPAEVVGVGEAGWRKGTDRFEAVAHELRRLGDVRCRWIGSTAPAGWALAAGSSSPVAWTGRREDPWADVGAGAVVVLPSREDPLPLAALEAGARGLAVVASGTGGLADLLDDDRGWFVGGADVRDLARSVQVALDRPEEAARRGSALRAHVEATLTAEVVGPRWLAAVLGR
jgi:glycosyltransferase involved in cell wall biosynthesis